MQVYKSKVLSFVEYCTPAVCHATKTTLAGIDAVHARQLVAAATMTEAVERCQRAQRMRQAVLQTSGPLRNVQYKYVISYFNGKDTRPCSQLTLLDVK